MNRSFCLILIILTAVMCYIHLYDIYNDNDNDIKNVSAVYNEKVVAITFDDGPGKNSTAKLLEGLKQRDVVATFFLVGENIEGNEELVKQMYEDGHLIGNHTYTHVNLSELSRDKALLEIQQTSDLIESITGERPEYIRPPCGEWKEDILYEIDITPVFWSVDPVDWNSRNVSDIVKKVVSNTEDGSIILLHDIYDTSVAAAFEIIDQLKNKGYVFVTVDEILIS